MEFWWNVSITMPAKFKHNKPDLLIWCHDTKTCKIFGILNSVPQQM